MKLKLVKNEKDVLNIGFLEALAKIRRFEKIMIAESGMDITPKELNYIALINREVFKQSELQQLLDVSKGTLSNMVKLLVKKSFIIQEVDKFDKRVKRLLLTALGKKAVKLNIHIRTKIRKRILTRISSQELNQFMDIVLKMRD